MIKNKILKNLIIICINIVVLIGAFLCMFFLVKSDDNMNSKQGLPDIIDCNLDFSNCSTDNKYLKQHMKGEYKFYYNKWIVEENYTGKEDAIVKVPHHYSQTTINNKKLDNSGYSSYQIYLTGLKKGTKIWFMNNNFIGGFYAYVNKELVLKYGTRTKVGNCKSNGGDDLTLSYIVKDDKPIEIVFEVASSYQGGLTSPPRLVISNLDVNPITPNLTNNIGFFMLGLSLSLFIFSLIINMGTTKRSPSIIILMIPILLINIFSIDIYWRILSFLKTNTYNTILEKNIISFILLIFTMYYHLIKTKNINSNKFILLVLILLSISSIIGFYTLMGTFYQIIPCMLLVVGILLLIIPLSITAIYENKKINIVYILLLLSLSIYAICTFFDLENIMIAGLEQSASYIMLPVIICFIILYRISILDSTKRIVKALEIEKEQNRIKAESLKAQIKPHFIFNCLSAIQRTYQTDQKLGEKLLTKFSIHLRNNVDSSQYDTVLFSRELDNILNYVELENMRRDKKIEVLLDVGAFEFNVPLLCLQPFIENAFKYSHVEDKKDGYIQIKTAQNKNNYIVVIKDNGVGFNYSNIKKNSVGIKNAKERLELISNAKVKINSKENVGTEIIIFFPKDSNGGIQCN